MKKRKVINSWLSVAPRASADDVPTIYIFDQIGKDWWSNDGVSAKDFQQALAELGPTKELVVEINSPGGNVWDGLSIYNMLRGHGAKVTTRVTGLAASIASIIALAGDTVEMSESALFMIHKASGIQAGNADEMRKMAEMLDKHDEVLAGIYVKKTGKTAAKITELMAAETWYSGTEAKEQGFVDTLVNLPTAQASFDFSRFRRVPSAAAKQTPAPTSSANTEENMNREKILARLKQRGISIPENATDDQLIALLEGPAPVPTPTPAPAPAATATPAAPALTAEAIAAAVVAAMKPANKPAPAAAHDPSQEPIPTNPKVENLGNPLLEQHKKLKAGAERTKFLIQNHTELLRQSAIHAPQNANTFASGLVVDYLADGVLTVATNRLAVLSAFTREFSLDTMRPRATVQVKKFTTGTAAQSNATNFESNNDSTLAATSVTVNQVSSLYHVPNADLQKGFALADLAAGKADILANGISDVLTALMVSGNYGSATAIGAASSFDSADLPAIKALAKNYRKRNLILDGGHLAYLLPTDRTKFAYGENGAFGFDGIYEQNRWTSAETNAVGFVCGPEAIAICSGLPVEMPAGEFLQQQIVTTEQGLSVLISIWYSRATRTYCGSMDVMFGAAAADTTQAEVLVTS